MQRETERSAVTILLSDKIDFKSKRITLSRIHDN